MKARRWGEQITRPDEIRVPAAAGEVLLCFKSKVVRRSLCCSHHYSDIILYDMGSIVDSNATGGIPFSLAGKVALVTGAGRGIGAAMAMELARCGAKVVVNYAKSAESAGKVVAGIKQLGSDAVAIQADCRKVADIERLFEEASKPFGQLDIVCSNAGVVSFGHLEDVTEVSIRLLDARPANRWEQDIN
jgi:hypothetical protein